MFQILGTGYTEVDFFSIEDNKYPGTDAFTKVNVSYPDATATIKVGTGVKSEGELIVSLQFTPYHIFVKSAEF